MCLRGSCLCVCVVCLSVFVSTSSCSGLYCATGYINKKYYSPFASSWKTFTELHASRWKWFCLSSIKATMHRVPSIRPKLEPDDACWSYSYLIDPQGHLDTIILLYFTMFHSITHFFYLKWLQDCMNALHFDSTNSRLYRRPDLHRFCSRAKHVSFVNSFQAQPLQPSLDFLALWCWISLCH